MIQNSHGTNKREVLHVVVLLKCLVFRLLHPVETNIQPLVLGWVQKSCNTLYRSDLELIENF